MEESENKYRFEKFQKLSKGVKNDNRNRYVDNGRRLKRIQ